MEANLVEFNRHQYIEKKSHALPEPTVQTLKTTLSTLVILQQLFDENGDQLIQMTKNIICEVFDGMFVTAKTQHEEEEQAKAEDNEELSLQISTRASAVWDLLVKNVSCIGNATLLDRMKRSIANIRYSASPSDSVRRIEKLLATAYSDDHARDEAISVILGTEQEWKKLSDILLGQYTNEYLSLGIVDVYAALSTQPLVEDAGELTPVSFDIYGLSAFGRFALFLGEYLSDAHVRKQFFNGIHRDWVMRQLMMTSVACEQGLTVPGICRVWESKAVDGIRAFVQSTKALFSDWLISSLAAHLSIENVSEWNGQLLKAIKEGYEENDDNDRLLNFVTRLMKPSDNVALSANALQRVLQRLSILVEWSVEDLEKWLPLVKAESLELDLLVKVAILNSFKNTISATNGYKHYQSDLASKLSGVSKLEKFDYDMEDPDLKKKNNYSLLALLNASSLKYGSFDIPRQRIMYLIQGIRPMLQNDEDDYDFSSDQQKSRVQAQLAQLLKHLADSVQDISGGHWEFFLQCCFGWVACADASQPEELLVVYNALELFNTLYILSEDNEELSEAVRDHLPIMSKALLELMAKEEEYLQQKKDDVHFVGYSKARLVYQTLMAELLENIPEKTLIESECFKNVSYIKIYKNDINFLIIVECINSYS